MNYETVNACQLISTFNKYVPSIKILSLDCFDTILWRKTATPIDVFYDLDKNKTFNKLGFTGAMRIRAEIEARHINNMRYGSSEVKLEDIYKNGFCTLNEDEISQLVTEELDLESEMLYPFLPMVDLIREAKKRNIKVVIVSDTYISEQQLKKLLSNLLPTDVYQTIDKIYCSCEYKRSKTRGIFLDIIKQLGCQPNEILHIGDNKNADYIAPKSHQINAVHFLQYGENIAEMIRLHDIAGKIIDPAIGESRALYSPFRSIFSVNDFSSDKPFQVIGYASLGPVMYAFASYIETEFKKMTADGKNPKVIFIMRDGYLPYLACKEFSGIEIGKPVRISRFSAYAASFYSMTDIESYLVENSQTNRYYDLAKQLLLPEDVASILANKVSNSKNPAFDFYQLINQSEVSSMIFERSKEYRSRLLTYLQNQIKLESGSTLLFVDLGYSGSAQRRLTPMFNEIGINVTGCYLLSLNYPGWEKRQKGLIDPSWCDTRTMRTLVYYITWLEQLSTSNERSVIDYTESGEPIYSDVNINHQQHEKLKLVQEECIKFIRDAKNEFERSSIKLSQDMLRQVALTELTRMIYMPLHLELDYLKSFEAEMNLGTNEVMKVFDPAKGLEGLRRRGMFYMEKPSKTTRTNYPAEMRVAGIELALTLMSQNRFGLNLKMNDMGFSKESIDVEFRQGNESFKTKTDIIPTHNGYFALWLPTHIPVSILLGTKFKWIQLDSMELIPIESFVAQIETENTMDATSHVNFNSMLAHDDGLYELTGPSSAITLNAVSSAGSNRFIFRLVFRPIIRLPIASSNQGETKNCEQRFHQTC